MDNTNLNLYGVKEIASKVWLISDNGVNLYLIEGEKKALLIDTGWGIGNLSELVSNITSLPLTVINTHGHIDHTSGNNQFNDVYIHDNDMSLIERYDDSEARTIALKRLSTYELPEDFSEKSWINAKMSIVVGLNDQKTIDLGERIIDIIEVPGHTPGSICLYDRNEMLLFTGDTASAATIILIFKESTSVERYLQSLKKLVGISYKVANVLPAHGNTLLKSRILLEISSLAEKIVSGEVKGIEQESILGTGLLAKNDFCSILYREDNIKSSK